MTFVSRLAIAMALSLGATATVASVAVPAAAAQKNKKGKKGKQEAPTGPSFETSEAFRKVAQPVQDAIAAKDYTTAAAGIGAVDAAAKSDDEKYFAGWFHYQIAANKQDTPAAIAALESLIANPKTPVAEQQTVNYERGRLAAIQKKPKEALPYLEKARALGSTQSNLTLLIASAKFDTGDARGGVSELNRAIEAENAKPGGKAPEDWYNMGVSQLYRLGDRTATTDLMSRQVRAYPTIENWRKVIVLYRDSVDASGTALKPEDKLQLFRMMRGTGALVAQKDYFDYADLAFKAGFPWESVSVVTEAQKKGVTASAPGPFNDVLADAKANVAQEGPLANSEKDAAKDSTGKTALQTGDAYLASDNNAKALELYQQALQKGGIDVDQAHLNTGVALVRSNQIEQAKAEFAQVKREPLADIAKLWTTWIDMPALQTAAR